MSKFVVIEATGLQPAFYDDAVHGEIPAGAVPITDDVWQDFLSHQGQRKWNAGTSSFDAYAPPPPPASPPPPRRATLAALFDPLSPGQRGSITTDHLMRLQADAATAPDGTVYVGSSKVARAAGDLGMAPGDWFKLAGV